MIILINPSDNAIKENKIIDTESLNEHEVTKTENQEVTSPPFRRRRAQHQLPRQNHSINNDHEYDFLIQSPPKTVNHKCNTKIPLSDVLPTTDQLTNSTLSLHDNYKRKMNYNSANHTMDAIILFGFDISSLSSNMQFYLCASGVFIFTLAYGYLQELLSVHIAGRKFAFFVSACQFGGYSFWSFVLMKLRYCRYEFSNDGNSVMNREVEDSNDVSLIENGEVMDHSSCMNAKDDDSDSKGNDKETAMDILFMNKSWLIYVGLSILRAIDVGMTNYSMRYLNYPAKTLIKSSRVVFTMVTGVIIGKKRYTCRDYLMVGLLVAGLGIFVHADIRTNVIFHPLGVLMLIISLCCDGIVSNFSELIMRNYKVSQDEFQLHVYSISFMTMIIATLLKGELFTGIQYFFFTNGSVDEIEGSGLRISTHKTTTYSIGQKILVLILFTSMGLFGSSCAGAITKKFGALSMSITSTARKACTLFLSFALPGLGNQCTIEHVVGMVTFICALCLKSLSKKGSSSSNSGSGNIIQ